MSVKVFPNPEKLSKAAAQLFLDTALEAVRSRGQFTAALSGGGSPQRMYEILASEPLKSRVPWNSTFIFWGDERFVPADDPQNNALMTREKLLDHVPIPSDHIFPVPTAGKPRDAAREYASTLRSFFDSDDNSDHINSADNNSAENNSADINNARNFPRFDFMLLGLGENGHTASLFPKTGVLREKKKWVDSVFISEKDQYRITLTYPVINHARNIVFLVHGKNKAAVVHEILEGPSRPGELPAQGINPSAGEPVWLIDKDAAAKLKSD